MLLVPLFAVSPLLAAEPDPAELLGRIRHYIKPLDHPLADRLPILTWQRRTFPTGLEDGRVDQVQQLLIDRGLSSFCNALSTVDQANAYLPVLKYRQEHGFPVCILPQGWLQIHFVTQRRGPEKGRYKSAHQPPADAREKFPCPAVLHDRRTVEKCAARTSEVLAVLRRHGIKLDLLVVDFEAGAYLRNKGDQVSFVRQQAAMARKCPRCVAMFTEKALATPGSYAAIVDRSRASFIHDALCAPARKIYPDLHVGNYYAWPSNRVPRPEGRWPAYGYEGSGMNVAMPRVYMNAGWGGAGQSQQKMNWNAFHLCLKSFSPPASVLRKDELLIPWVHVWLGGKYLENVMRGRKLPEPWVMKEMACHMMLRGAETFAVWMDAPAPLPADYPFPEYAAMGQFVYDVRGVQEGFREMLALHSFLRSARPLVFDVPGAPNELGPGTATWSAMQTAEKTLVRTVVFDHDKPLTKTIRLYDRSIRLPFAPRGQNFWVYPDGKVEPAKR